MAVQTTQVIPTAAVPAPAGPEPAPEEFHVYGGAVLIPAPREGRWLTGARAVQALRALLELAEDRAEARDRMWFWSVPDLAADRRSREAWWDTRAEVRVLHHTARTSRAYHVQLHFYVDISCTRYYPRLRLHINDQRVNLRTLRAFVRRVKEGRSIAPSWIPPL